MKKGDAKIIEGADWNLEIGGITEIMSEIEDHPLLLFDKIKDYPTGFRVVTNYLSTMRRAAFAYGIPSDLRKIEMVRFWKEKMKGYRPIAPVEVDDGPILENVVEGDEVDMLKFPSPQWHELDGGRYIGTACSILTKDPEEGWANLGTYRVQLHSKKILGFYISPGKHGRIMREKYWARGKNCPVVMIFGIDPILFLASCYPLTWGKSELDFAGWLRGSPVKVINSKYYDLQIPAEAEIAIEGEAPPPEKESMVEGPFGEWTGYYAHGARPEPIVHVKRVLYRNDPIITGLPPTRPTVYNPLANPFGSSAIWYELENSGIPDIRGVWTSLGGISSAPFVVASIKQRYPGHARQTALAIASGKVGGYHGRYVIVVDEDIDPSNINQVIWALATRADPASAINTVTGAWSTLLDPAIPPDKREVGDITNSRALITAVRPYHWMKQFAPVSALGEELKERYMERWGKTLGIEQRQTVT